jgi:DNA replication protein DnaC
MSELVSNRIRRHADKLGLSHLGENLTELAARADAAQLGYLDFLDQLLEDEVGEKESRRFRNALRLSGLPHHRGLDEFDFAFQPALDARKVKDLAGLGFIGAKSNVALLGPPGVGKTMLAVGLAVAACQAGYSIYFTTLDDLIRRLRAAENTGRFARQLRTYLRPAALVLDEVGYLPLTRDKANMLFQLVSLRYEAGPIILTSNKALNEWGDFLGDEVLATAILDRLLHHCDVLAINGPSWRLKDRLALVTGGEPMPSSPRRPLNVNSYAPLHIRSYADNGRAALDQLLKRLIDIPTPTGATPREIGVPATATLLPIVTVNHRK